MEGRLEIVPDGGHINADAGFGPWPDGWLMVGDWLRRHGLGWPESEAQCIKWSRMPMKRSATFLMARPHARWFRPMRHP